MKIPGSAIIAKPLAAIGAEWDRMAPRERRLVAGLAIAVVVFASFVAVFFVVDSVSSLGEHNDEVREALAAIAKHGPEWRESKSHSQALDVRIGSDPPQIAADVDAASKDAGVQVAEQTERPTAPSGRRYVEHSVDLRLRQVDLMSLTKFLKKLETGPRMLLVTRLSLKRRFSDADKLDAEMTVVAFEKIKETARKKGAADKDKGDKGDKPGKEDI